LAVVHKLLNGLLLVESLLESNGRVQKSSNCWTPQGSKSMAISILVKHECSAVVDTVVLLSDDDSGDKCSTRYLTSCMASISSAPFVIFLDLLRSENLRTCCSNTSLSLLGVVVSVVSWLSSRSAKKGFDRCGGGGGGNRGSAVALGGTSAKSTGSSLLRRCCTDDSSDRLRFRLWALGMRKRGWLANGSALIAKDSDAILHYYPDLSKELTCAKFSSTGK
jgi:hypothetical protein